MKLKDLVNRVTNIIPNALTIDIMQELDGFMAEMSLDLYKIEEYIVEHPEAATDFNFPADTIEVVRVFLDDKLVESTWRKYTSIETAYNNQCYIDNSQKIISFPDTITSNQELKLLLRRPFDVIEDDDPNTEINIPNYMRLMLRAYIIYNLASYPDYYSKASYEHYRRIYYRQKEKAEQIYKQKRQYKINFKRGELNF